MKLETELRIVYFLLYRLDTDIINFRALSRQTLLIQLLQRRRLLHRRCIFFLLRRPCTLIAHPSHTQSYSHCANAFNTHALLCGPLHNELHYAIYSVRPPVTSWVIT